MLQAYGKQLGREKKKSQKNNCYVFMECYDFKGTPTAGLPRKLSIFSVSVHWKTISRPGVGRKREMLIWRCTFKTV